ncbi:MAG: hypothetical protein KGO81_04825 [Bacteroidota bacterium]|nr:hypothetical protein [Bacteroidota bacterium]
MKKFFYLLLFLLTSVAAFTQNGKLIGSDGVSSYLYFYDTYGNLIPTADMADVNGSPMLKDGWGYGVVKLKNGQQFVDSLMNFSLFENKLFYKKENKVFVLPYETDEFLIVYKERNNTESKYHFKSGYPDQGKNTAATFYQVLYEGANIELLDWEVKRIEEHFTYGNVREKDFVYRNLYFLYDKKNKSLVEFPTVAANLAKKMPLYEAAIKNYLSAHKVNYKVPEQVAQFTAYLDEVNL